MKKEYQKHIVSTPKHQVWLHRTSRDLVDKIMREGFLFLDLTGTATLQPTDPAKAENVYATDFGTRKAVVVVKIPQSIASQYYPNDPDRKGLRAEGYAGDREVSYWHPKGKYAIQRQHVHGWIDKETEEYHPNPYLSEPQEFTAAHFPKEFYGGLEKDILEPEKQEKKKVNKKSAKLKRGELPPPPTEIIIVP